MGKYRPMRSGQSRLAFLLAVALVACWSGAARCYGQKPPKKRNITVVRPAPETTPRSNSYYALIIGINDYEFFTPLETPRSDAKEVAAVLHDQYAFKTQVLLDATRDKILDALSQYRSDLNEDDNLLIYYAGHGYFDKPSDLAYWYPVEAGKASTARWINASEITGQTRAIAARHVLVIADSCYSGMMTRTVSPAIDAPLPRDEYIRKLLEQKSRHVLSSGGNEPVADRDTQGHPTGHSVFANVLLEALRDLREDQYSGEELFHYIRERVGGRSQQIPEYNPIRDSDHNGGDFVFLRSHSLPPPPIKDVIIPAGQLTLVDPGVERPRHRQNPDEAVIRAALNRYQQAYESMDIDMLKAAWPTMSKTQIQELKDGFKKAQAVKVQVDCEIPTTTSDAAHLSCVQSMAYTRDGRRQPEQKDPVEISVKKVAGDWVVSDVRGRD